MHILVALCAKALSFSGNGMETLKCHTRLKVLYCLLMENKSFVLKILM